MVTIYRDQEEAISLSPEDRFFFNCHAGLACFNRCCQNPTIILKPYDIIRLRRRLEITSTEFLERYTIQVLEDRSYLPLVLLDIDQEERSGCPFLESSGCSVYDDRPGACRLFPITQGSCLTDDGLMDRYFCKRLDFCQGFTKGQEWTLGGWKADQGLEPFNELNREWIEIILKKSALNTVAAEDTRASAIFSMAAYDIDRFRKFIFETPFLEIFEIPQEVAAALRESDRELLRFGYKYVKLVLLLEDAAKMKEEMRKLPEPPQGN
jgi:Fe-S-cluster containining protein